MSPLVDGRSYWMDTAPPTAFAPLTDDVDVDACVVGGGISGLFVAWELASAGMRVVVLERGRIAASVTGHTTAKVTSHHGLRYRRLEHDHGPQAARAYGTANEAALEFVRELVGTLDIDAHLEARHSYVYATDPAAEPVLRDEARAAAAAGLPASFTHELPLSVANVGAVRVGDQAQLHPRRLLLPLATALAGLGCGVHEQSEAASVERVSDHWEVTCAHGRVRARELVVATLLPALDVARDLRRHLYCHQGYAVALPLRGNEPDGIFISSDRPMRSVRTIPRDADRLLQIGGGAFVARPETGASPWDDLETWAADHFDVGPAAWRWSTQDYSSTDGLPLVGRVDRDGPFVVAGFGGWGMTTAVVAARIIGDELLGRDGHATIAGMLDPRRSMPVADHRVVSAHTSSGSDRDASAAVERIEPGAALVVSHHGEQVGVHRDSGGTLHAVSAVCTHLGGILLWDHEETAWTCPCHGSRFAPDGEVLAGPASDPLPAPSADLLTRPGR